MYVRPVRKVMIYWKTLIFEGYDLDRLTTKNTHQQQAKVLHLPA